MRALLASPLGFLIGLSLGALGGGGSILAVPALVYAAGQDPKAATTTSLVLVTVTALVGIIPHWRAGRVRVGAGVVFGLAGIGGSLLGSRWNQAVDADVLLLAFAVLMLVAAYAMWRRLDRSAPRPQSVGAAAAAPAPRATSAPSDVSSTSGWGLALKVILAGSFIGLLTGFFGVGGGFVIVPALVLALGFSMPDAVWRAPVTRASCRSGSSGSWWSSPSTRPSTRSSPCSERDRSIGPAPHAARRLTFADDDDRARSDP
jgi:uncharacterized membrane protein YfcA